MYHTEASWDLLALLEIVPAVRCLDCMLSVSISPYGGLSRLNELTPRPSMCTSVSNGHIGDSLGVSRYKWTDDP